MKRLLSQTAQAVLVLLVMPALVGAEVSRVEITSRRDAAAGRSFGSTGVYERLAGKIYFAIDPANRRNQVIADLDKAPRNAAGNVEYEVDFYIMRPADLSKGNGRILYEVTNRGRKLIFPYVYDAHQTSPSAVNEPTALEDAGNGFALREGYTLVWSGWDPDAPRAANGMAIKVPVATENGKPIVATIREELVFATRGAGDGATMKLSYEAAVLDKSTARLTARAREARKDPRLSLAERYASDRDYVNRVAEAAQRLVQERLLLADDAARYVSAARARNPMQ